MRPGTAWESSNASNPLAAAKTRKPARSRACRMRLRASTSSSAKSRIRCGLRATNSLAFCSRRERGTTWNQRAGLPTAAETASVILALFLRP